MNSMLRLQEILGTMDVPQGRLYDLRWLKRNLFVKNDLHKDLVEAESIIHFILYKAKHLMNQASRDANQKEITQC